MPISGTDGTHIWQEVPNIVTSKQNCSVFMHGVKYMKAFVLLFETKMSAPGGKQSWRNN